MGAATDHAALSTNQSPADAGDRTRDPRALVLNVRARANLLEMQMRVGLHHPRILPPAERLEHDAPSARLAPAPSWMPCCSTYSA